MIKSLIALFENPDAEHDLPDDAGREAVAALLVAAARSDDVYAVEEREAISSVLGRHYDISAVEAEKLRTRGEAAEEASMDLVRFTRAIKRVVPHEERVAVIEAIWEIAYADGARGHEESALVRKLCGLLYVEDKDAGLARQRVKDRLGL